MGVDIVTAKFLSYCKTINADFINTATLGKQSLYVDRQDVADIFERFGIPCDTEEMDTIFGDVSLKDLRFGYADEYFRALGASSVDAIDASDYEGASIIHDMNFPISQKYASAF